MQCGKCHSPRITRFLDGYGEWRIFCRTCKESIPIFEPNKDVKKLTEFTNYYINH